MKQNAARENVLGRIRDALQRKTALPFPDQPDTQDVFKREAGSLRLSFEKEFTRLLGQFHACRDQQDMFLQISLLAQQQQWKNCCIPRGLISSVPLLRGLPCGNTGPALEADVIITDCECLLARTGTVVISSAQETGRSVPVYTPIHVIIAFESQLVADIRPAMEFLRNKYPEGMPSMLAFSTGPSRTGDIEKTLVVGVHGPRQVILFLLPD